MSCELCGETEGVPLWRSALCRVMLVKDVEYPGLCHVILNRHVKEMTDLSEGERSVFMEVVFVVESALREVMQPDKVNLASLGNMTPHLHWHVIPRYNLDKHFPNSIWGLSQRAGISHQPPDLQTRLAKSLYKRLSGPT